MAQKLTYCPVCGHELTEREEGGRLRPTCPNCGYVYYHNPVPGVGLLIEMNGGIVLIQRGNSPHKGDWTLPSGFVEADETTEEAAIREAEEETGLKVEIVEMMGVNSFPEGPPVSGIMIFYRMRPVGGELRAGDDAAAVKVFAPGEVPLLPFRTHREVMGEWLERYHKEALPNTNAQKPQSTFTVRAMLPEDMGEVIGLLAMIPANRDLSQADWHAAVIRMQEAPQVEVFIAETVQSPTMIIGCVALSHIRGITQGMGFVNDMAVLPTYQRRGVGAELLEAAIRRAGERNLTRLLVNTQRANDQARAFYAATGFATTEIMDLQIR